MTCTDPRNCDEIGRECSLHSCPFGPHRTDRASRRSCATCHPTPMHFLTIKRVWAGGSVEWAVTCEAHGPEAKAKAGCAVWEEADPYVCSCTDPTCEGCQNDDHYACVDGFTIEELGPSCKCRPTDLCGAVLGLQELGSEMVDDIDVVTQYPIPVDVEWDDGYCTLIKWAPKP